MSNARLGALETRINRLKDMSDIVAVIYPNNTGRYILARGGKQGVLDFDTIDEALEKTQNAKTIIVVDV